MLDHHQFGPCHEIMVLFVLRKLILQTRMHNHPMGLDVRFFGPTLCLLPYFMFANSEALVRLGGCAGSLEPSMVAYVVSTIISWAGSFLVGLPQLLAKENTMQGNTRPMVIPRNCAWVKQVLIGWKLIFGYKVQWQQIHRTVEWFSTYQNPGYRMSPCIWLC